MVSLLFSREGDEFDHALFSVITPRHKPAAQIRKGPVHIAIGGNLGESSIHRKTVVEKTRARFDGMPPGVEGAEPIVYFGIGLVPAIIGLKVEASAKSCRSVSRSTYPPLNLYIFYRGGKVRHVDPKDAMRLCIVEWNAVDGGVDAGLIGASDTDARVAHSCSRVRVAYHGR